MRALLLAAFGLVGALSGGLAHAEGERALSVGLGWATFSIPGEAMGNMEPDSVTPDVGGALAVTYEHAIGTDLALRMTWHDPSKSPDPEWNEWQAKITSVMEPHEDGGEAAAPSTGPATAPAPAAQTTVAPLPDMLVVQFPPTVPTGMERPYFLMGNSSKPVYLWKCSTCSSLRLQA